MVIYYLIDQNILIFWFAFKFVLLMKIAFITMICSSFFLPWNSFSSFITIYMIIPSPSQTNWLYSVWEDNEEINNK